MRNISIIVFISFLVSGLFVSASAQGLNGIEKAINEALGASLQTGNSTPLDEVFEDISVLQNKPGNHWVDYWTAYTHFQYAVYYGNGAEQSEEKALEHTGLAKNTLLDLKDKNSEDYALLALIQSNSLRYVKGMAIMSASGKAEDWANRAIEKDENNPRAYYVSGVYDFYKPSMFGGGRKCKKLLTTALSLYEQALPNPILPSWGFDDTYAKLARSYRMNKGKDVEKAKEIMEEGLKKFPYHYDLVALEVELNQ